MTPTTETQLEQVSAQAAALLCENRDLIAALELAEERIEELERWAGMPPSATLTECRAMLAKAGRL